MVDLRAARLGIDPYLEWIEKEGVITHDGYYIYLKDVETKFWPRVEVNAAACHLKGRGDFGNLFVFDIPPAGSTTPQRHLYEEVVYVLEGTGSTQLEFRNGERRSFEWGERSMFAIPLNASYRHFNSSGRTRALLSSSTNLPLVMNTFYNEEFVFDTKYDFNERLGREGHYTGEGDLTMVRPGNNMWETNFVPDLEAIELKPWGERGGNSTNIMFILANGLMHAHISEMPVGTYKKAHRHGPGLHVMCVSGTGYSLLWFEGDKDFRRIDWKHGLMFPPADQQFHQHFNTSQVPARYFATGVGSMRYPFTYAMRRASGTLPEGSKAVGVATSVKDGGDQIEYEDQDPRIQPMFAEECRKNGIDQQMDRFFSLVGSK